MSECTCKAHDIYSQQYLDDGRHFTECPMCCWPPRLDPKPKPKKPMSRNVQNYLMGLVITVGFIGLTGAGMAYPVFGFSIVAIIGIAIMAGMIANIIEDCREEQDGREKSKSQS